jgi:hypothetical protein
MTEALTDVRQISKLAYGFMASKALFAALHVELFRHLSQGADTLSALSAATGVRPQPLATLLATLRSVGLITADSGKYANAPAVCTEKVIRFDSVRIPDSVGGDDRTDPPVLGSSGHAIPVQVGA